MKFSKIKTILLLAILVIFCCGFTSLGGNFAGNPEDLEKNISDGAKNLIESAYRRY